MLKGHLLDISKKLTVSNQEKEILNPDIDDTTLDIVYHQKHLFSYRRITRHVMSFSFRVLSLTADVTETLAA